MRFEHLPDPPADDFSALMRAIYTRPVMMCDDEFSVAGIFGHDPRPRALTGYVNTDAVGVYHPPLT